MIRQYLSNYTRTSSVIELKINKKLCRAICWKKNNWSPPSTSHFLSRHEVSRDFKLAATYDDDICGEHVSHMASRMTCYGDYMAPRLSPESWHVMMWSTVPWGGALIPGWNLIMGCWETNTVLGLFLIWYCLNRTLIGHGKSWLLSIYKYLSRISISKYPIIVGSHH